MRFQETLFALVTAAGFGTIVKGGSVPNGGYQVSVFENGTTIYHPLDDIHAAPIVLHNEARELTARSARFASRTDCWGYQLDVSGIDACSEALRNWAGSGTTLISPPESTRYIGFIREDVMVYYCINARNNRGNLDREDTNFALAQMDAKCHRYKAGWYGWDGSVEIVGKSRVNDRVCLG